MMNQSPYRRLLPFFAMTALLFSAGSASGYIAPDPEETLHDAVDQAGEAGHGATEDIDRALDRVERAGHDAADTAGEALGDVDRLAAQVKKTTEDAVDPVLRLAWDQITWVRSMADAVRDHVDDTVGGLPSLQKGGGSSRY